MGPAALAAAKTWAIAAPLGLVFRSILKGYPAPVPFIIVTMVVTGALTVGWRSALAALTKPYVRIPASQVSDYIVIGCNSRSSPGSMVGCNRHWPGGFMSVPGPMVCCNQLHCNCSTCIQAGFRLHCVLSYCILYVFFSK